MSETNESPSIFHRISRAITRTFFKGLLAALPIAATIYVIVWLASILESPFRQALEPWLGRYIDGKWVSYYQPGMGLVVGLLLIFILGLLLNAWIIREFIGASESLLQRLPLAKTIFSSVRDLTGFFSKQKKAKDQQVVLVELSGIHMLGFVTRSDLGDLPPVISAGDTVAVYCPMSYALGGYTIFVPRSAIKPVNMPMEQAMRFILTAGIKSEENTSQTNK
ncbi:MAG: DUF502 domain-containing protein [Phycisphaeraceae bacterium]|nr:DUF502 domain-containing protein [Phycisphaeraceae bacterium]